MTSKLKIIDLAESKLKEAGLLYDNGFNDSAYYLGGYVIELLLKARICVHFGIDDFFEPVSIKYIEKDAMKPFKVHDLTQLLVFSGIFPQYNLDFRASDDFKTAWSFVKEWNEGSRYESGKDKKDVSLFINSVEIIAKWIKNYL